MSFWFSRWVLIMKASIWRGLMAIGMKFHHLAEPRPPPPNFKVVIPSRLSPRGGTFKLVFYVPPTYFTADDNYRFPVVVNFHGGGFTLGTGTDDARWADTIIQQVDAVFVSVEYRLAPEYPFSVGVEDGTDAVLYLASHADELRLDAHRMALSGFSAGGNFAFTVPLMLYDLQTDAGKRSLLDSSQQEKKHKHHHHTHHHKENQAEYNQAYLHPQQSSTSLLTTPSSSQLSLPRPTATRTISSTNSIAKLSDLTPTALEIDQKIPDLTIKCIVSFYPPTDFRSTRDEKRATNPAPDKNLPPMLTNLFDNSYLPQNTTAAQNSTHPNASIDLNDPYLSPAAASSSLLRSAYPKDIILYTCEYDMLNLEGIAFGARLKSPEIGKNVFGGLVKGVPHAFDKKPNPVSFPKSAERCYSEACAELKRVLGTGKVAEEERRQLGEVERVIRFEEDDVDASHESNDGELVNGTNTNKERRQTTTEEDIKRMLAADGGKDHVLNTGDSGDERAERLDVVSEMNRGFGEGKPQIHVTGDDSDGRESRSEGGGKKERKRSVSNPGKALKLENMI